MSKCLKKSFIDKIAADLCIAHIKTHGDVRNYQPSRSYQCIHCGLWHLTSKTKVEFHKNLTKKKEVINTKKSFILKRKLDKQGKTDLKQKKYLKSKRDFKNK